MNYKNLNGYLERAKKLLSKRDEISLTYCALELRKAIELIVWTQFKDAFCDIMVSNTPLDSFDFKEKTQSKSIEKMYEMLKKYSPNYVEYAQTGEILIFKSASGDGPFREEGKVCYIPGELPKSEYKYLSEILHYEKEFYPKNFIIDYHRLKRILTRLNEIKENYTLRLMAVDKNIEDIIQDFKEAFVFDF